MKNILVYNDPRSHIRSGGTMIVPFAEVDKKTHMALGWKGKNSSHIAPEVEDDVLFSVFTPSGDARYLIDR
jgi:hypothetical protein